MKKLSEVLNEVGGTAAAKQFKRARQVLERMAAAGAVVIDGVIYTPAQTRVRKVGGAE